MILLIIKSNIVTQYLQIYKLFKFEKIEPDNNRDYEDLGLNVLINCYLVLSSQIN